MKTVARQIARVEAGRVDADTAQNVLRTINAYQNYLRAGNILELNIEGAGTSVVEEFGMFSVSVFPKGGKSDKPTGVLIYFEDYDDQAHRCARLVVRRARRIQREHDKRCARYNALS